MSVNPVVPTGAGAANVPVEQLLAQELAALAADAQALETQLVVGQVVTAQVLPSNGLTDLINILGNRVAAALPPNVQPGDLFQAQVTGFNGPQILLQFLNMVQPGQAGEPPPPLLNPSPLETAPDVPEQPLSALAAAASRPVLPDGITPSIAPPPAVFVAASVRPAAPPIPGAPNPQISMPSAQVIQPPPNTLADIEARLAAARAGQVGVSAPSPASGTASAPSAGGSAAPALPGMPVPPPLVPGRFVLAPQITPSTRMSDAPPPSTAADGAAPAPAQPALTSLRDPAALVRALNLPVTPTNIAAAKLALDTPQRLPAALATLESALPDANDSRITTLRTLTAFIGKIEPSSPQLAQQISSFVENVVTGGEPKIATMLAAQMAADEQAAAQPAPPPQTAANASAGAQGVPLPQPVSQPVFPAALLAQVAERNAALTVDLKTQILSLVNNPPNTASGELLPAATSALTAISAVQLNAAQAMNVTPQQMAFTLPMWLGSGYAQAHVAIDRDAPDSGGGSLDGDNFHIAFILDTKHLGTVTIDLKTVGRAFSLAVKAENEGTTKRFAESLEKLTERLQTLRYRVNSAEATVAPRGTQPAPLPPPPIVSGEDDGIAHNMNIIA